LGKTISDFLEFNTPKDLDEMASTLMETFKADQEANLCWVVDDILEVAHGYDKKNNGRKIFKLQTRKRRIKDRCDKTIPGLNREREFELNHKMVLGGCQEVQPANKYIGIFLNLSDAIEELCKS
jgi:hypothetical protein